MTIGEREDTGIERWRRGPTATGKTRGSKEIKEGCGTVGKSSGGSVSIVYR